MADEAGIPTASGAVPPWAAMGAQLLDALLERLKGDDASGPRDASFDGRPPSALGRRDARRLERTCRLLSLRNARAARALGACRCWGLNADCAFCGGLGRPGALEVDPEAFAQVVVPLLQAQPELIRRHLGAVEVVSEQPQ
jgi:hypothetical protein